MLIIALSPYTPELYDIIFGLPATTDPNQAEDPELQEEATLADIETCKLNFRIYWDDYKDRWFIPRKQSGCRRHNGHPYIEHPLLCIQPRHSVTATEKTLERP